MQPERPVSRRMERLLILRSFPSLKDLAPETLTAIAECAVDRFFPAGSEIYAEGRAVAGVHYVIEGKVEIRRRGVRVHTLGRRSVLGGLAANAGIDDGSQAVALEDTQSFEVGAEDLRDIFEDNFDMVISVMRAISRELIAARRAAGPGAGFSPEIEQVEPPTRRFTFVDRLLRLRRSPVFAAGRVEALADLASEVRERRLEPGEVLWREGDPAPGWVVVVAGVVCGENTEQSFRLGPGSTVGVMDALGQVPRWFTATAETPLVVLAFEREHVLDVFEDNLDLARSLLAVQARFLLSFRERLAGVSTPP